MLKRQWIMPVLVICGLVSGCSHNAGTLAENDPFHGKDPFQEAAARHTNSDESGVASVNVRPHPANTHWNSQDGWRSRPHVTHPEYNYEQMPSMSGSQVARATVSNQIYNSAQRPVSKVQNADYVVAKPVSTETPIQVVSAAGVESANGPKITIHDGLRFIETSRNDDESPDFVNDSATSVLTKEIPPFAGESDDTGENNPFAANPFEAEPDRETVTERTGPQNAPEWWNN